jgi:hypothetical protein
MSVIINVYANASFDGHLSIVIVTTFQKEFEMQQMQTIHTPRLLCSGLTTVIVVVMFFV